MMTCFNLSGKIAIVTGGSRGLGEEIAEGLVEAGASVMLLARREQWLQPALSHIRGLGGCCEAAVCDVSNELSVGEAVKRTLAAFGRIDILVNNAGTTWGSPAEEMPPEKFRSVIDINLTGAFLMSQAAGREMLRQGSGSIINVASIAGLRAMPDAVHSAGYVASKGGLIALTRELAAKWAPSGVRVNAIAPGFFPSRMTERVLEAHQCAIEDRIPMRRVGRAGELKGVAVFLASHASSYITGQTIAVDGGTTAA